MSRMLSRAKVVKRRRASFFLNCENQIFVPPDFLGKGYDVWRGPVDGLGREGKPDFDPRSLLLDEIDVRNLLFEPMLKIGQTVIQGKDKLNLLKGTSHIRLGGNAFLAFWTNHKKNGKRSALEWLRKNRNITWLDFFGLILRPPLGLPYVLCLEWSGSRWDWFCRWIGRTWLANEPAVVLPSFEANASRTQ